MTKKNEIVIKDNYAIIKFISAKYGEIEILIDCDDIERIKKHYWGVRKSKQGKFYVYTKIRKENKLAPLQIHRFIKNCDSKKYVIDHINGNTLDNRKQNLRVCTQKENLQNRKTGINNTSGFRNIYFSSMRKKWEVAIQHKKIGAFKNIEDAVNFRNNYIWQNMPYLFTLAYDR